MEAWGFEISASALLVDVEVEHVKAWHLQVVFAVKFPEVEEVEGVEALRLEADFAVGLLVDVEVEDVEASYSEGVAERSGDAEVEDAVVVLCLDAASVAGYLEDVEAVDVETLYFGDSVGLLVGVEVEDVGALDVETLYFGDSVGLLVGVEVEDVGALDLGDAVERIEDAEAEGGAVGLPEDAEVEEGAVGLLEDVEFEGAAALRLGVSAVEILVVVEAAQVFELVFGSSECSPDLDSAFSLEESCSFQGLEKEPLLEMGSETDGAADCQRARDCDRAAAFEVFEDDAEARLLMADLDDSQEIG